MDAIRILVEHYRDTYVVQCYRCQKIGHTEDTCEINSRCLKCGQFHYNHLCLKTDKIKKTPDWANYQGNHIANYRGYISSRMT